MDVSDCKEIIKCAAHHVRDIEPDYGKANNRLDTFQCWKYSFLVDPEQLVYAGFISLSRHTDAVQCFKCRIKLNSWKPGDSPLQEHLKYAPDCPYIATVFPTRK